MQATATTIDREKQSIESLNSNTNSADLNKNSITQAQNIVQQKLKEWQLLTSISSEANETFPAPH